MTVCTRISLVLLLTFAFSLSTHPVNASDLDSCGNIGGQWVTTYSGCSDTPDREGASCDMYQCHCGPDYDPSPTVSRIKCRQPAWFPPSARCEYLLTEHVREWRCNDELTCIDNDGDGHYAYAPDCLKGDDCDDGDPLVNPGFTEVCGDGIDNDCNTATLDVCFTDEDGDSYFKEDGTDLDDTNPKVNADTAKTRDQGDTCQAKVPIGSTANVITGELEESIHLFTTGNISLTLYYSSQDAFARSLGISWSHNYDYKLTEQPSKNVLLRTPVGKYLLYTKSGNSYSSEPGDYSELRKEVSGFFVLTKPNGTIYTFDTNNKIASIVDRSGKTQAMAYNGDDLDTVTDSTGRIISFNSVDGKLASVTDPAGNGYLFSVGDSLDSITYPDDSIWMFSYQGNAFMVGKVDPAGSLTTYNYDEKLRIIEAIDPEVRSRSVSYPENNEDVRTTAFTERDGSIWLYSYNVQSDNLISKTDPQGNVTSYSYDANHNLIAKDEPGIGTSTFAYDVSGNMISSTDVTGNPTTYTYNGFGQVTSTTSTSGETTTYTYDEQGNLIKITDPVGSSNTFEYDNRGRLIRTTSASGVTTSLSYDSNGNIESITSTDGKTTTCTYDASGNCLSMTNAQGNTTQYEYDVKGQLIKVIDAHGQITFYGYDANGNRTSVTDANGKTTTFEYNFEGQMIRMVDAMGYVTNFAYGGSAEADKLTKLTDAKGQSTTFTYDILGNLIQETNPLGRQSDYAYDPAGRVTSKTDSNGNTMTYGYDTLGRLIDKTYPDGTQTTFSYDLDGNLLSASNQHITYNFTYDVTDQLISVSDSNSNLIDFSYDVSGKRTALSSNNGIVINYNYDEVGRLSVLQSPAGKISFGYDELGWRKLLQFPTGVATTYSYDTLGRLTDMMTGTGTRIIAQNHYTHDTVGNRISKQDVRSTTSYSYDDIYRLTAAKSNTPGNSPDKGKGNRHANVTDKQKEFYQYDPVGNRITSSEHKSYSHNNGNELLSADHRKYTYDANGNRTSKTTSAGTTTYIWDYENRLKQVVHPCGKTIGFAYDPFGRRISKIVNGVTTSFTYDSEDILFETTAGKTGNIYIHGPGIDEPLALLGQKGQPTIMQMDLVQSSP